MQEINQDKPYRGFSKLAVGYHKILRFRAVKNKYLKSTPEKWSILIELENEVIYLPQYFADKLNDGDINELNSNVDNKGECMYLFFGGQRKQNE